MEVGFVDGWAFVLLVFLLAPIDSYFFLQNEHIVGKLCSHADLLSSVFV